MTFHSHRLDSALELVGEQIAKIIGSSDQLVLNYVGEFAKLRGKRLRPRLLIVFARLFSEPETPSAIRCAACCELLHTASLIHDDVIDEADTRRGDVTINHRYGNEIAVIVGDYLMALVLDSLLKEHDFTLVRMMLDASKELGLGVIQEIRHRNDFTLTEKMYYQVICMKTAALFSLSCQMGAYLGGAGQHEIALAVDYGRQLGLAFQVVDDLLDLTADPSVTGKPSLSDLREGRVTLPLIHALGKEQEQTRQLITSCQAQGSAGVKRSLIDHLARLGSIEYAYNASQQFLGQARDIAFQLEQAGLKTGASEELKHIEQRVIAAVPLPALKAVS